MRSTLILLFTILYHFQLGFAQTKVAILDFENTSGISKYDGFGKALSNMLITDLKNTIHPRKVVFLERSQLNKILDEQNLQKSKSFDKSTAVSFGKLAGVNFVLVGSVYVLDGKCVINSRFVDVQTSEIVHSKESNGDIKDWLQLKTTLAEELSKAMSNPVSIDAQYSECVVTEGVLNQYSKVIDKIDAGDIEEAQEMNEMLSDVQPDFKYFDELKLDLEELKKQVEKNKKNLELLNTKFDKSVENPISEFYKFLVEGDLITAESYLTLAKSKLDKSNKMYRNDTLFICYNQAILESFKQNFEKSIELCESVLEEFPYYFNCRRQLIMSLIKNGAQDSEVVSNINFFRRNYFDFHRSSLKNDFSQIALVFNGERFHTKYFDFFNWSEFDRIQNRLRNNDSYDELKEDEIDFLTALSDNYVFASSFYLDETLNEKSYVSLMQEIAHTYFDTGNNEKGIEIMSDLLNQYAELITDYRDDKWDSYPFNDLGDSHVDIMVNASWYITKAELDMKIAENWINDIFKIGMADQYSLPTMVYINLGHCYDYYNLNDAAKEAYCIAFNKSEGYTNVREIIEMDRKELGLSQLQLDDCK